MGLSGAERPKPYLGFQAQVWEAGLCWHSNIFKVQNLHLGLGGLASWLAELLAFITDSGPDRWSKTGSDPMMLCCSEPRDILLCPACQCVRIMPQWVPTGLNHPPATTHQHPYLVYRFGGVWWLFFLECVFCFCFWFCTAICFQSKLKSKLSFWSFLGIRWSTDGHCPSRS